MCVYKQDIKIYKAKLDRPKGRHNNSNYCRRILIPLLGGASRTWTKTYNFFYKGPVTNNVSKTKQKTITKIPVTDDTLKGEGGATF